MRTDAPNGESVVVFRFSRDDGEQVGMVWPAAKALEMARQVIDLCGGLAKSAEVGE